jgi:YVTN family beta-propeller protein
MDDNADRPVPSEADCSHTRRFRTGRGSGGRRRLALSLVAALGISLFAIPVTTPVSSALLSTSSIGCAGKAYWPVGSAPRIAVVDLTIDAVSTLIELPLGASTPERIAVSPNGEFVLTASGSSAYLISSATNAITAEIEVGSDAKGVAFHPTKRQAYVANSGSGTVSVIDVNTASVISTIEGIPGAYAVAINGEGSHLVVTSTTGWVTPGSAVVINSATEEVTHTFQLGIAPLSVAMSRNGNVAYVVNAGSDTVSKLTLVGVPNLSATWALPSFGWGASLNPDASLLYVGSQMGSGERVFFEVNTATGVVTTVPAGIEAQFVAVTDDGTALYASGVFSEGGQPELGKFDSATRQKVRIIPSALSGAPNEIALCPTVPSLGVPDFTLSTTSVSATVGTGLSNPYSISINSWAVPIFAVSPQLPMGIIFNAATAALTGTPLMAQAATTYTITANSGGNARSATFDLTINAAASTPSAPPASGSTENDSATTAPTTTTPAPLTSNQPTLVTSENQDALTQVPGGATAMVNGVAVPVEVTSMADSEAAQTAPELRTAEQIAELQQAAAATVARLDELAAGDGSLTVVTTDTGAGLAGIFPDDVVPIEDVILLDLIESAALFAARSAEGEVIKVQPGAILEVNPDGEVAVLAYGLPVGDEVELVIMSVPTLLGRFNVGPSGEVETIANLPIDIAAGDHTLVVASENVQAALGLRVAGRESLVVKDLPVGATLPSAGLNLHMNLIVVILTIGSLMALIGVRRRWVVR